MLYYCKAYILWKCFDDLIDSARLIQIKPRNEPTRQVDCVIASTCPIPVQPYPDSQLS